MLVGDYGEIEERKKKRKWWIKKKREELIAKGCDDKKANALAVDAYWEKQKAELPPKKRKRIEFSEHSMQDSRAWPNPGEKKIPKRVLRLNDPRATRMQKVTLIAKQKGITLEKAMVIAKRRKA